MNVPHCFPWLRAFALITMIGFVGCGEGSLSSDEAGEEFNTYVYALSTTIWSTTEIPVCWENPTAANAHGRALSRQGAQRWEAVSAVRFTGWGACHSASPGIRILIQDSGPHAKGLGTRINRLRNGMVLNFTFRNWSPSCQGRENYCIPTIATHEFGHAIGFAHEQNRGDTPGWCKNERQGSNGDIVLSPWDLHSTMNYCNPHWSNHGNLSQHDIEGVRYFYGKHPGDPCRFKCYQYSGCSHSCGDPNAARRAICEPVCKKATGTGEGWMGASFFGECMEDCMNGDTKYMNDQGH